MLALLGAMKEEITDLKDRMVLEESYVSQNCHIYKGKYENRNILLAKTGIGRERAEKAARFIFERYPVTTLVSLGFAGALTEELEVGDVILCANLYCENGRTRGGTTSEKILSSDSGLISTLSQSSVDKAAGFRFGSSVTVMNPASTPEMKRKIGRAYQADIVDMESYWIARIASERRVPFITVRAITDTVRDTLPPFDRFWASEAPGRWLKATLYFISSPKQLIKLFTLYRNARRARKNLTAFIDRILAGGGIDLK